MANAPDDLVVTGPNNAQVPVTSLLITPTGGTQKTLGAILGTGGEAGSFTTLTASSTVTFSPASKNVVLSPSGTGVVTIAPATTGTMDNVAIGGSTPLAGAFTTVNGTAFTGTYFTATAYFDQSVGNALTAAGTTRTDALALAAQINSVTTAGAGTGVTLPAVATAGVGSVVLVFNAGANAIKVYGAASDTIDGTAGATGVTLTNTKRCSYTAVAAATWISAQLGVTSA